MSGVPSSFKKGVRNLGIRVHQVGLEKMMPVEQEGIRMIIKGLNSVLSLRLVRKDLLGDVSFIDK